MAWNRKEAAQSMSAASSELDSILEALTPEQVDGVRVISEWWREWYNGGNGMHPTGHKALGRLIIKV